MTMRLSSLIEPIKEKTIHGEDLEITGLSMDSRNIEEGFLFVAVPGTQKDGRDYIKDALSKGAVAILAEEGTSPQDFETSATFILAKDIRAALSLLSATLYPEQPQTIAAVTGTSGKTSTVQFTRQLWTEAGHKAAGLGTLGLIAPGINRYGSLTTPDPVTLHQALNEVAAQNVTHAAMEASSHGIELKRLDNVNLSIAAFTNLSRDHLDYHGSMENYLAAKARLFEKILPADGTAVLNADIPEYEPIKEICERRKIRTLTFGHDGQDLTLLAHATTPAGQGLRIDLMGKPYEFDLPLIGEFQTWNAFCALMIAIASGEDPEKMVEALTNLKGVPGRLEKIGTTETGGIVFVDYAHKPAALENVLTTLRPHVAATDKARLHVVFGCGGDRDKGKRPLMGEIAERLADKIIVTDDNPRGEAPAPIRKEILDGCKKGSNLREVGDRKKAIFAAIDDLEYGDVLVIAGKGHEEGQIVGDKVLPFNDADVAREAIKENEV